MIKNQKIYIAAMLGLALLASSTLASELLNNGYRSYASIFLLVEGLAFIGCILSAGFTLLFTVIWLTDKQWSKLLHGLASVAICAICFVVAAYRGVSFMYAT